MVSLSGKISDKIRAIFPKGHSAYTPPRPPDSTKMPKSGVKGQKLGRQPGRTYKPNK